LITGCFITRNKPATLDFFNGDLHWDFIRSRTLQSFQSGDLDDIAGNKIHSGVCWVIEVISIRSGQGLETIRPGAVDKSFIHFSNNLGSTNGA
jgi:hypothetical protein